MHNFAPLYLKSALQEEETIWKQKEREMKIVIKIEETVRNRDRETNF